MFVAALFFTQFQVDFATTCEELKTHFSSCGTVQRVTIIHDKATGRPKGYFILYVVPYLRYAYVEFADPDCVEVAVAGQNGSMLHNRPIKVLFIDAHAHFRLLPSVQIFPLLCVVVDGVAHLAAVVVVDSAVDGGPSVADGVCPTCAVLFILATCPLSFHVAYFNSNRAYFAPY